MSGKKRGHGSKSKGSGNTSKPVKRTGRRPNNSSDARPKGGKSVANSGTSRPADEKQHLSAKHAALVFIPFVALFAGITWWVLSKTYSSPVNSDPIKIDDPVVVSKSTNQNSPTDNSSQNSPDKASAVWRTVEDQEKIWDELDNASQDGWTTEVFSDQATEQLTKLKKLFVEPTIDSKKLSSICVSDVKVHSVIPKKLTTVFENGQFQIQRGDFPESTESVVLAEGTTGLAVELEKMLTAFTDRSSLRAKLKVFRVDANDQSLATEQTLEIYGVTDTGQREESAVWRCEWTREDKPRIKSIEVVRYEAVSLSGKPMFSDCTESLFANNPSFSEQLLKGFDYWLNRRQVDSSFVLLANNGIAVGDVNADGLEDVYLCQESGLPNLLFLQQADGSLKDVSKESGMNWLQNSSCALILDFNNDGHEDLAVAVSNGVVIGQGDSTGKFTKQLVLDAEDDIWSMTSADYDNDGLLDIYTGAYSPNGVATASANVVLSQSLTDFTDGGQNHLFRNMSTSEEFSFVDVTAELGLDTHNGRHTFAAAWEDYDNDGDQDLYVANDFGWNNFYRNDSTASGVQFVDIAEPANARDDSFGMSVNWADYDRDGWMDVYISNMYSYAGNRITFQDQFKADSPENVKKRFQRYARGNTLLRNSGIPLNEESDVIPFEDRTMETAVNQGRWAWSSCFIDVNNDGWEDLFVNNGYITASDSGDL